jgi:tetratricopeptide (TPR) repeat protein
MAADTSVPETKSPISPGEEKRAEITATAAISSESVSVNPGVKVDQHHLNERQHETTTITDKFISASDKQKYIDSCIDAGIDLFDENKYTDAIAAFDKALVVAAKDVEAHYGRGRALAKLGRHLEALATYDELLAIDPKDIDAQAHRALTLGKLKRRVEEVAAYNRLLTFTLIFPKKPMCNAPSLA